MPTVSSRPISIGLRATSFNITIIQVYAPTSKHENSEVDRFYQQFQETFKQTPKKDTLVVQGDWNAKVGRIPRQTFCAPYCNDETNERDLRPLQPLTFPSCLRLGLSWFNWWVSFAPEFQCCYFCESSCLFYLSFNFDFYVSKIMHL